MRWFKNLGLTFKLNLVVTLTLSVMLVVLIAVTQTLDDFTLISSQQRVAQEVEVIRRRFAEVEQAMLLNTRALATTSGLAEAVAGKDEDAIRTTLLVGASRFNFDEVIDVIDVDGNLVFADMVENAPKNNQLSRLRSLALIGSDVIDLVLEEGDAEPNLRLVAVAPIRDIVSGQIVGGLLTSRNIDGEFMAEVNLEREDVHIVSIAQGRILPDTFSAYGAEEHQEISNFASVLQNQVTIEQAINGQTVIGQDFVYAGDLPYIVAHMPLSVGGEVQSAVGVMVELGPQLAFQRQFINSSSMIYVLLAVAAVIVIGVFSLRSISLPINKLRTAAEQFEQGDFEQRAQVTSGDEVGQLADSFNNMAEQVQELIDSLENRVAQRTRRLEIVAALSERLSAILNMDELLAQVVNQVQENFGYYHAHIYLLDEAVDQLVMMAGTGQAGARMKADGHHIALSAPASLVARAARRAEIIRVDNVRESADWLPNPLLPDTHSEMAVPILDKDGRVVGVLDVQQNEIAGLDEGDAALLRSLANQVAVAIRNARLFSEVETALKEARALQLQYIEQGWDRDKIARRGAGHVQFSTRAEDKPSEEMISRARQQALTQRGPGVVALGAETTAFSAEPSSDIEVYDEDNAVETFAMVAPIMYSNVAIGNLQLHGIEAHKVWTETELAIIGVVSEQVAQVAERLRLFEETQERASRERLIAEISDKMRRATNLESLMKVTTTELANALKPARIFTKIEVEGETEQRNEPQPQPANPEPPAPVVSPDTSSPQEAEAEKPPVTLAAGVNGDSPLRSNGNGTGSADNSTGDTQ